MDLDVLSEATDRLANRHISVYADAESIEILHNRMRNGRPPPERSPRKRRTRPERPMHRPRQRRQSMVAAGLTHWVGWPVT